MIAKVDAFGKGKPVLPIKSPPFEAPDTEADLEALNEKAKDPTFVAEVVDAFKTAAGRHTAPNGGKDMAHKIIDRFGTRKLFFTASWTGGTNVPNERKVFLKQYENFLSMFQAVVTYSDAH